jgi:3-oxoacyl-[acyl-carrier-protein] synthase II
MRKAVITGIGAISAIGKNTKEMFSSLKNNKGGIGTLENFDTSLMRCKTGAEIKDFIPHYTIDEETDNNLTNTNRFALHAACEAWQNAGLLKLSSLNKERIGTIIGISTSGMQNGEKFYFDCKKGRKDYNLLKSMHSSVTSDLISWYFKLRGIKSTLITACSSGANAIGTALEEIRNNSSDIIVCGGSDALCRLTFSGFNSLQAVDLNYCKPFSGNRSGLSLGEGAGILIVEEKEHAIKRGAKILCEVTGFGNTCDSYHVTAPHPEGLGASNAIKAALKDAGLSYDKIDYVNAHGTGTLLNDASETKAIKNVFKEHAYKLKVSSSKSFFGHTLGASGALEAIVCALALNNGYIPPTLTYEERDPECDLNYVPSEGIKEDITCVLSNSFAFGGNNTSLIFSKEES